jgi:DNA-binding GntR family transcriptional regulator
MVIVLGVFVVRAMLRGEVAAELLQRDADAQERYIRALLSWGWAIAMVARGCCPDATLPLPPIPPNGKDAPPIPRDKRTEMRLTLVDRLSMDELRDLAFDLGFNHEGHATPSALARALVEHIDKHHLLDLARERLKKRADIYL